MSSILKALKKLEQEKAARKPDSYRIDAEILRGGGQQRSFFSKGATLAAIALFLCGVGATYLFMKHDQTSAPVQQSQYSKSGVKGESTSVPPQVPKSTILSAKPQNRPSEKIIPVFEKTLPSLRSMEKQHQTQRVSSPDISHQNLTVEQKTSSPSLGVAPVATPVKTVLKVHGIAFQDGAESAAVVNGVTVSNGSVIEGARVEEIQKDRVRFSRGGETFDIILDKSN